MAVILSVPILGVLTILQSAVISRMLLLQGAADLVLVALVAWGIRPRVKTDWLWSIVGGLFVSYVSSLPFGVLLAGYLATTAIVRFLRHRIWKVPVLAMLTAVFVGTLITHFLSIAALLATGAPLPVLDSLNLVTLPSLILNLMAAGPVYVIVGDLANWVYPEEMEIE